MRFITKQISKNVQKLFQKLFLLERSDRTILIQSFCLWDRKMVEISINCLDTLVIITIQYFEVACNVFSSVFAKNSHGQPYCSILLQSYFKK